jgi:U3 small nucleolar ribonucleoprotein protein IMP4
MLRRQARLRREYLYRKSLEGKESEEYEKKRLVKQALQEGKPLPTETRGEEQRLRNEIDLEDDNTAVARTHVDDEYAKAGARDPKVLITTSRDPSSRLKAFAKELKLVFPNAQRMNRGNQVVPQMVEAARSHDFTDIVLVQEHRGEPDGMIVCHLPFGPTAYFGMYNTVLRHNIHDSEEIGTVSQANPHIILENFSTKLGHRTSNILKHLFPCTKKESKRTVTFVNKSDFICFRHHTFEEDKESREVELKEQGPRFDLRLYQIKLGTMEQTWAENEWVLRPFQNSAKRQKLAS